MGIGIEVDAAGIGNPASSISILYRNIPVLDWHILIPLPAVRHSDILLNWTEVLL
jgi:hypothetical protein